MAINTAAGSAQRASDRPVVTRAHATFSAAVVGASLLTGALRGLDAPVVTPFVVVAGAAAAVAVALARAAPSRATRPELRAPARARARDRRGAAVPLAPLLVLGGLGALAFAVENAHQSWSALYLEDELGAGPAVAAAGPAVFAAVIAVTRFASAGLAARRPAAVMVAGSALAAAGTAIVAGAGGVPAGLAGLALAAAGTAALFPTLMSVLTATVPDERRGTATSVVTTVAYLGLPRRPRLRRDLGRRRRAARRDAGGRRARRRARPARRPRAGGIGPQPEADRRGDLVSASTVASDRTSRRTTFLRVTSSPTATAPTRTARSWRVAHSICGGAGTSLAVAVRTSGSSSSPLIPMPAAEQHQLEVHHRGQAGHADGDLAGGVRDDGPAEWVAGARGAKQ